jgi:hypothetical protein
MRKISLAGKPQRKETTQSDLDIMLLWSGTILIAVKPNTPALRLILLIGIISGKLLTLQSKFTYCGESLTMPSLSKVT